MFDFKPGKETRRVEYTVATCEKNAGKGDERKEKQWENKNKWK
jgi:hypothetical protein